MDLSLHPLARPHTPLVVRDMPPGVVCTVLLYPLIQTLFVMGVVTLVLFCVEKAHVQNPVSIFVWAGARLGTIITQKAFVRSDFVVEDW